MALTTAGPELVTNASNFIRGYDPQTGRELWRLGGSSKITAPTPIFAEGLFVVASGRAPERPIFAIRPGSRGDLTLGRDQSSSRAIAWSWTARGSYMPTPLAYERQLYVLANNGVLDAYDLKTGRELARVPTKRKVLHGVVVTPDDRYAFVTVEGVGSEPGTVEVIDLATLKTVATLDVASGAAGIDFYK